MRALALVEAPDHVCGRYRVRAFAPALSAAGIDLTVEGLAKGALARLRQLRGASRFGAVLLQRKLLPGWQLRLLRSRAPRLLFDFDDAVMYRDSYDPRGPHCRRRAARFARTVRAADLCLAGNAFLAGRAREAGARAVAVLPTCIDTDRYRPRTGTSPRGGLDLVWIGSSSTLQGLEARRGLLERIGREVPGARLRVICDRFPDLGPLPVVPVPWSEATEAAELAEGAAGISWIPDDLWSRGKCGLKVLQYGASGLPTIANPVGVHPEMIEPGVTGFLPTTDDEWLAAVKALAADPAACARMGAAARANVESRYGVRAWESRFVAALSGAGTGAGRAEPPAPHVPVAAGRATRTGPGVS
jgi:glycosyltransferase involved in cell wall biosynthesis